MRRIGLAGLIGVGIMLGSLTAGAQERGQFGLVMGYPTAVGVAWHATDRVAIKAEATFSVTSSELDSGPFLPERDLTSSAFGIGIAGLFYAGRADNVSLYFSPRFGYGKATSEIEDGGTFDQGLAQRGVDVFIRRIVRRPVFAQPPRQRVRRARTELRDAGAGVVDPLFDRERELPIRSPVGRGNRSVLQLKRPA